MCKSPPEFIMQQIILRLNLSITYLLKVNFKLLPGIVPMVDTFGSVTDTKSRPPVSILPFIHSWAQEHQKSRLHFPASPAASHAHD